MQTNTYGFNPEAIEILIRGLKIIIQKNINC